MAKLFFVVAAIALICLAHSTDAKKRKGSKNDKHCKQEGDPPNHSFSANSMCTTENSLMTMDRTSGRKPASSKDNKIKCKCYEPGWQQCKNKGKGQQQSGSGATSSPNGSTQQGVTYEENPRCYDGNSENRSKKCNRPVVLLIEDPCRCHEQGWNRCDRSSTSSATASTGSSSASTGSTGASTGSSGASTGSSGASTGSTGAEGSTGVSSGETTSGSSESTATSQ